LAIETSVSGFNVASTQSQEPEDGREVAMIISMLGKKPKNPVIFYM
jgi:hypothetical protein